MPNPKINHSYTITTEKCSYCNELNAKFAFHNGKFCCEESQNSCPSLRNKNSKSLKNSYKTGKRKDPKEVYKDISEETKQKMNWSKGLTKNEDSRIMYRSILAKQKYPNGPFLGKTHKDSTKQKISIAKSEYLKNPKNRKNYGRHKKSYLELSFENWLTTNNIKDYECEKHFYNKDLQKNYYVDFIFESQKIIVELDGTQHNKTIEKDRIRDDFLSSIGYIVYRISYEDYKSKKFEKCLLQILSK